MRKISFLLFALIVVLMPSCKTTEANYRSAYDRAVAARDSSEYEAAIYGTGRNLGATTIVSGNDTIECRTQRVALAHPADRSPAFHDKFNVVVGQFKQEFNAKSMCKRLIDAGYAETVVVQTGEPYYYVLLSSHDTREAAVEALKLIPGNFVIPLRKPLPYLLYTP